MGSCRETRGGWGMHAAPMVQPRSVRVLLEGASWGRGSNPPQALSMRCASASTSPLDMRRCSDIPPPPPGPFWANGSKAAKGCRNSASCCLYTPLLSVPEAHDAGQWQEGGSSKAFTWLQVANTYSKQEKLHLRPACKHSRCTQTLLDGRRTRRIHVPNQ